VVFFLLLTGEISKDVIINKFDQVQNKLGQIQNICVFCLASGKQWKL
jgi:hypothetical protein